MAAGSTRREQLDELFKRATNLKLVRSGTNDVEGLFREAVRLSDGADQPWPQLAAYRLALVLLRSGSQAHLNEVDVLLERASACVALGAHPALYRLAVLHRLQADASSIEAVFRVARSRIADRNPNERASIQGPAFNMLELAACFLGRPLDDLEGTGELQWEIADRQAWTLVSNVPEFKRVRYSRELALCELEAIGRRETDAILFREPATSQTGDHTSWRTGSGLDWKPLQSDQQWKLVRCVIAKPVCRASRADIARQLHPRDADGLASLRQTLRRTQRQFRDMIGHDVLLATSGEIRIDDGVKLYGVTPVSRSG